MALNRRVEILLEEDEYEVLRQEAERRGWSFGELMREAARRQFIVPSEREKDEALAWLTSQQHDIADWEEAKKLIGRWVDKEP